MYLAMPFINEMATMKANREERKEQILRQWRETKNFPRKKEETQKERTTTGLEYC